MTDALTTSDGFVYYIQFAEHIKIGTTTSLARRMTTFSAHPDSLLAVEPGGTVLERIRHRMFAADRVKGRELFRPSDELLEHITHVRAQHGDPKQLTGRRSDRLTVDIEPDLHQRTKRWACVNPDHIELVTNRENILRGIGLTARLAVATECVHGHAFTPENTRIDYRGNRECLECRARIASESYARRKAARRLAREANPRLPLCKKGHLMEGENLLLYGRDKKRVCRICNIDRARRKRQRLVDGVVYRSEVVV